MSDEIPDGQISGPSLGHLSPQGVPMDAFLRAELDRRKEVANRPETIEAVTNAAFPAKVRAEKDVQYSFSQERPATHRVGPAGCVSITPAATSDLRNSIPASSRVL